MKYAQDDETTAESLQHCEGSSDCANKLPKQLTSVSMQLEYLRSGQLTWSAKSLQVQGYRSSSAQMQIVSIMYTSENRIHLVIPGIHHQKGSSDCGL